ncbi:unnamed protein product [Cylicocyclus nassatus]|uniref:Uncharacterized protein n=1 Tax=Cylicocyclus nassatus TaxID=53992 RepID=A0AA36DSH7_CYLNA|nr:unnamed protein product [Cylicocyclus nassatus]
MSSIGATEKRARLPITFAWTSHYTSSANQNPVDDLGEDRLRRSKASKFIFAHGFVELSGKFPALGKLFIDL